MLDIDNLDDNVRENILSNLGCESEKNFSRGCNIIASMSPTEALDKFLTWNGIIGYTHLIIKAYENLKASEIKP